MCGGNSIFSQVHTFIHLPLIFEVAYMTRSIYNFIKTMCRNLKKMSRRRKQHILSNISKGWDTNNCRRKWKFLKLKFCKKISILKFVFVSLMWRNSLFSKTSYAFYYTQDLANYWYRMSNPILILCHMVSFFNLLSRVGECRRRT